MSNPSRTNWDALNKMSDDDIDYSDIPPLGKEFFAKAMVRIPAEQARHLVSLDDDVLTWFQSKGPDYQSIINSVLRSYISEG